MSKIFTKKSYTHVDQKLSPKNITKNYDHKCWPQNYDLKISYEKCWLYKEKSYEKYWLVTKNNIISAQNTLPKYDFCLYTGENGSMHPEECSNARLFPFFLTKSLLFVRHEKKSVLKM